MSVGGECAWRRNAASRWPRGREVEDWGALALHRKMAIFLFRNEGLPKRCPSLWNLKEGARTDGHRRVE